MMPERLGCRHSPHPVALLTWLSRVTSLCAVVLCTPSVWADSAGDGHASQIDEAALLQKLSRAEGLLALNQPAAAERETRNLPVNGPHGHNVRRLRAWALLRSGRYGDVIALLRHSSQLDSECLFLRAAATRRLGRGAQARSELQALWWEGPDTLWGLAALRELGAMTANAAPYTAAERRVVHTHLPRTVQSSDAIDTAVEQGLLDRLRVDVPADGLLAAEMHHAHGCRLLRMERFSEAVQALARALDLAGDRAFRHAVLLRLAEAHRRRGEYDAALQSFDTVADSCRDKRLVHRAQALAGQMAIEYRRYAEARSRFQAQLMANPVGPLRNRALWGLGWVAFRTGDFDSARQFFNTLVTEAPFGELAPAALYWKARGLQEQGFGRLGRVELAALAERFPVDYYTYRATQRLGPRPWPYAEGHLSPPGEAHAVAEIRAVARTGMMRRTRRLLLEASYDTAAELGPSDLAALVRVAKRTGQRTVAARLQHQRWMRFPDGSRAAIQTLRQEIESSYTTLLARQAEVQRIDAGLVVALVRQESGFRATAVSPVGALGLMQLMPTTARQLLAEDGRRHASRADILDPKTNVAIGVRYFARMLRAFGRRAEYALAAYNAGPGAVTRWREGRGDLPSDIFVEEIPYAETRRFVKKTLGWRQLQGYLSHVEGRAERLLTAIDR